MEFAPVDGKVPYEELLALCDPDKMTFEMDLGWVKVAGQDPVALMKKYPHRFSMFHVKDFHLPPNISFATHEDAKVTELGRGSIDYRPIFAQAAENQKITHAFVEQERIRYSLEGVAEGGCGVHEEPYDLTHASPEDTWLLQLK